MTYREMSAMELAHVGEVNREEIEAEYVPEPDSSGFGIVTRLEHFAPPKRNPAWGKAGTTRRIKAWNPSLAQGGFMFGAFADKLVGFVILGPTSKRHSAEIAALFTDRDYRRQGVGAELMRWAENRALESRATTLYLYSNPTVSSTSFYLKMGFEITGLISKHIVADLPGDILMAKKLSKA